MKSYLFMTILWLCLFSQAKNALHREGVKKAASEGIQIQGQQGSQLLSQDFIDEALIISDLFDLNEYAAVELLMAGRYSSG